MSRIYITFIAFVFMLTGILEAQTSGLPAPSAATTGDTPISATPTTGCSTAAQVALGASTIETIGPMRITWTCIFVNGTPVWSPAGTTVVETRYANTAIIAYQPVSKVACTTAQILQCIAPISSTGGIAGIAIDNCVANTRCYIITYGAAIVGINNTPVQGDLIIPSATGTGTDAGSGATVSTTSNKIGIIGSVISTTQADGTAFPNCNASTFTTCVSVNFSGSGVYGSSATTTLSSSSISPAAIAANSCSLTVFTVNGLAAGANIIKVTAPSSYPGSVFPTVLTATATNTATVLLCNTATLLSSSPPSGVYVFTVMN